MPHAMACVLDKFLSFEVGVKLVLLVEWSLKNFKRTSGGLINLKRESDQLTNERTCT